LLFHQKNETFCAVSVDKKAHAYNQECNTIGKMRGGLQPHGAVCNPVQEPPKNMQSETNPLASFLEISGDPSR